MSPRRRSPVATLQFSREWLLVAQLFFDFVDAHFSINQALTVGHNAFFPIVIFSSFCLCQGQFLYVSGSSKKLANG